jgi:hypothetical protein
MDLLSGELAFAAYGSRWSCTDTDPWQPVFVAFVVGPESLFQIRPRPADCDPGRASTPHPAGIQICLADGSVRALSTAISAQIWWSACSPTEGDPLPADWE